MLGVMVGVLVRYFLERQIGVGAGFWLFGLFSLMRLSTRFEKMTFLYLFVSLALGILSSLMQAYEIGAFLSFWVGALVMIIIVEIFLRNEEVLEIRLPEGDIVNVREIFYRTIPGAKLTRVRIPEIKDGSAVVQMSYVRQKR